MFVQECLVEWVEIYKPDKVRITSAHPPVEHLSKGVSFDWGELTLSIQWGWGNYCENNDFEYYYSPLLKTEHAELALIYEGEFVSVHWKEYDELSSSEIIPWQSVEEIELTLQAIVEWAGVKSEAPAAFIIGENKRKLVNMKELSNEHHLD